MAEVEVVRAASMSAIPWLVHGFSTRCGGLSTVYGGSQGSGDLNLGFTEADERENVVANRELFLKAALGDGRLPLVTARQVHSSIIRKVTVADAAPDSGAAEVDGMLTGAAGILLGIQTADCIPVLVADRRLQAVAAFHAGWRGTVKRIVEEGVGMMRREFNSQANDLVAAIGPGIGQCCYEVGEEVRSEFTSQFSYAAALFRQGDECGKPYLDLVEANRRQLLNAGLSPGAISVVGECTSCRTDRYFSYRAEGGFTGRMLSVIGIRPA